MTEAGVSANAVRDASMNVLWIFRSSKRPRAGTQGLMLCPSQALRFYVTAKAKNPSQARSLLESAPPGLLPRPAEER